MSQSNVCFISFCTTFQENFPQKLECLAKKAGMLEGVNFNDRYAAIKIHFGEPGNLSYLRPSYSKVIVGLIKSQDGRVFLTDCNTLYVGGRKNALDRLDTAYKNDYNPFTASCHVLIADGLKGTDETLVPIDEEYIKETKIGRATMDADVFISLTHFKGHEDAGFGGIIKNISMDYNSRTDKMEMHNAGKPHVVTSKCVGCGACQKNCAHSAITITEYKASIDHDRCMDCGRCIDVCPMDAMGSAYDESNDILNCKIAECTYAVLKDCPHFHISLVVDVSPYCDCYAENDVPVVPNVGTLTSFNPIALDMTCVDAVNRQPATPGSILSEKPRTHYDRFTGTHPGTN